MKLPGLLCLLLLACCASLGRPLRLGVIVQKDEFPEGYHKMKDVAQILKNRDHVVEYFDAGTHYPEWDQYLALKDQVTPRYDAILVSGNTGLGGEPLPCPADAAISMRAPVMTSFAAT